MLRTLFEASKSPLHQGFLTAFIVMLGEAPAGLVLPDGIKTNRPQVQYEEAPLAFVSNTQSSSCRVELAASVDGEVNAASGCQQDDDDGIILWSCWGALRWLPHDAQSHCFYNYQVWSGPGSSNCIGACGAGCIMSASYTQDCGDHDYCCLKHGGCFNPWDASCGDEYWDADDDFLWSWLLPAC